MTTFAGPGRAGLAPPDRWTGLAARAAPCDTGGMSFLRIGRRIAGAVAVAALCTCGTLDRFDVGTSASADIPKATLLDELLGAVAFPGFDEIDFSQDIANQGVTEDQIDSVVLGGFTIHTDAGSGATLDFIESASFFAEAEGLPRVLVATSSDFAGKTSVDLDLVDVELKPYVVAPSMTLSAEVKGKKPQQDTTVTADVTLTVDATVPGCE